MIDQQTKEQDLAQSNWKLAFSRQEEDAEEENKVAWSTDKLLKYIVFVQRYIEPVCDEFAEMIIQSYYQYLRGRQTLAKDRKTIRMLESLIRLAEAHARLMFKKDIEIFDAINVVVLMEHCINTGLYDKNYCCLMSREVYS
jgi:DNA helicase MCM9